MLPPAERLLKHNNKEDAILYLRAWANLLEDQLIARINIGTIAEHFVIGVEDDIGNNPLAHYSD
jgi:hypothetical protein